jgi:hypothetical protein
MAFDDDLNKFIENMSTLEATLPMDVVGDHRFRPISILQIGVKNLSFETVTVPSQTYHFGRIVRSPFVDVKSIFLAVIEVDSVRLCGARDRRSSDGIAPTGQGAVLAPTKK